MTTTASSGPLTAPAATSAVARIRGHYSLVAISSFAILSFVGGAWLGLVVYAAAFQALNWRGTTNAPLKAFDVAFVLTALPLIVLNLAAVLRA